MISIRHSAAIIVGLLCSFPAASTPAAAAPEPLDIPQAAAAREAWLVTYGPGPIYWQRFGHNAIWLREPALELDHAFNFGYFDFEQEDFLSRFIRGRMLYFSLARPAAAEFEAYRAENRSIHVQKLDLDPKQYRRLREHLRDSVRPENRDYLYDYYLDNCSTRVRDALDAALEGALFRQFSRQPAQMNFRDHTRRLTSMDYWYYLGLEAGLGLPVDRPNNRWEEMFIPAVVSETAARVALTGPAGTRSLVGESRVVFEAGAAAPPASPPAVWPRYLLLALALAAGAWLAGRYVSPALGGGLALGWVSLAGTAGAVLCGLWGFTDHHAAGANANVLLLNPLCFLALVPAWKKLAAVVLALGTGIACVLALLPGGQYNVDVLALAGPLNMACSLALWRGGPFAGKTPPQGGAAAA